MLGLADALGVTCGHCHVGGDRATWDSTNFATDSMAQKVIARAMFRMTDRLNADMAATLDDGDSPITCATCSAACSGRSRSRTRWPP